MNLLEHYVTEVLGPPYQCEPYTHWFVKVKAGCYGSVQESTAMCRTEGAALAVGVGYMYMG